MGNVNSITTFDEIFEWCIDRQANGTYTLQNQLYDIALDKMTVSSIWCEGSYVYVVLQISP